MSLLRFIKNLLASSRLKVRVEGTAEDGSTFVLKMDWSASLETPVERDEFLKHARNWLYVEKGIRPTQLRIIDACEVYPDIEPDGKVRFEATLDDGRKMTGRMPYEGNLATIDMEELRTMIRRQLRVQTGHHCKELRITGAY